MYPRSRFLALSAASIAVGVPAIGRAQTAAVIRLGTVAGDGYAEPYYAADQGFFKRAGIEVDVQTFGSGAAITAAVASGALDVGLTNPISLANAADHGIPLVFFAAGSVYNRLTVGFCVAHDSPIKTARDLNGKAIGTTALNDSNSLHVRAWVDQNGGDSSTLQLVEMPFATMATAVARGTVAAAPIAEPVLTDATKDGRLRVLAYTMDVYGKKFMVGGFFTRSDWAAANADLLKRLTKEIYTTARWANTHMDQTALILASYAKLDPAVIRGMNRSPYAEALSPAMFQTYLDLGYKYKYIARQLQATQLMIKV